MRFKSIFVKRFLRPSAKHNKNWLSSWNVFMFISFRLFLSNHTREKWHERGWGRQWKDKIGIERGWMHTHSHWRMLNEHITMMWWRTMMLRCERPLSRMSSIESILQLSARHQTMILHELRASIMSSHFLVVLKTQLFYGMLKDGIDV